MWLTSWWRQGGQETAPRGAVGWGWRSLELCRLGPGVQSHCRFVRRRSRRARRSDSRDTPGRGERSGARAERGSVSRPSATAAGHRLSGLLLLAMAQQGYVMDVRVPEGAQPGQTMLVAAPTGQQVHVEIPAYATPGSTIAVSVPAAGPAPTEVRSWTGSGGVWNARRLTLACARMLGARGLARRATTI